MQRFDDRSGRHTDVDDVFADPAFAPLKAAGAAFAVVALGPRRVVWANAAAMTHWHADDAEALGRALFGSDGRPAGWLDAMARGAVPGRPPRLARAGLTRGFLMRAETALTCAWTASDGSLLLGFALPLAAGEASAGDWRHPAPTAPEAPRTAEAAPPAAPARPADEEAPEAGDGPGADAAPNLARRSQLAILRDRLNHAVDGAASLRLLWRTDAADTVTQVDADTFARLGSPVRFGAAALPDVVAGFDPTGAERLRAALAGRTTWTGITLALPVADGAATAPMALSASPILGADRAFAGFRGFGIVDLTRLDLVPLAAARSDQAPPAPRDDEVAATSPIGPTPTVVEAPADAAGEPPAPQEVAAEVERSDAAEAPEPAIPAPPPSPDNVVHLRSFQASASVRVLPAPTPTVVAETETVAESEGTEAPAAQSDALAFLALGEALRARIDALPRDAEATMLPEAPAELAEAAPAPDEPREAPDGPGPGGPTLSLDLLPMGLLVMAGRAPVFANAAAAARLGYPSPRELLRAGEALMAPEPAGGTGVLLRRGGDGAAVATAARTLPIAWDGADATLWILDEPDPATPARPVAPPVQEAGEEEAGEEEARAGDLLDRVDDAVALLDADGRIRRLNRRGEGWFGRPGAEGARGESFTEMLAPESRPAALGLLGEVRAQRDGTGAPPLKRDVLARTGEGTAVPMVLTLGRLGAAGFYATLRDVTALRRAETERARTERDRVGDAGRLSGLLDKVNHEIRTPLSAILGFAEVMMDERFGPLGNPRYKDYLKDIHASGRQVVALVGDLLDLSRIEAGQLDLDVAAVDVNRIVAETVAQMQPEAHRERVIMRTSLAGRVPSVLADERSARQIVRNLLSNAVKFNEPGGQVIVSTALSEAGTVLLRVRDTGVGMTDEEIAAALEPFGGTAAARPADGNGLGLPLTRALVGANGASMAIRSRPHEGTLVEIAFTSAGADEARLPA